jgi:hypothetical protein
MAGQEMCHFESARLDTIHPSERSYRYPDHCRNILQTSGMLHVKQRAGHLSYVEDPKGYRSLLAKSLTNDQSGRRNVKQEVIKSFSSDPRVLAFAESFCDQENDKVCMPEGFPMNGHVNGF